MAKISGQHRKVHCCVFADSKVNFKSLFDVQSRSLIECSTKNIVEFLLHSIQPVLDIKEMDF